MEPDERTRTVRWSDPAQMAKVAHTMSGMDYLCGLRDGKIEEPPIARLLGSRIVEVEEGRAVFQLTPSEFHCNPNGIVHGGVACSLLDAATGAAVYTKLPLGVGYTTIELKVNYLRPITLETGPMRCEGTVLHLGNRIATSQGRLTDASGALYAFGVCTCMVFQSGWK